MPVEAGCCPSSGATAAAFVPEVLWNLNGVISFATPQAGSFDGLLTTDPLLDGAGPFDGTRLIRAAGMMVSVDLILRVPPTIFNALQPVGVEIYRIRAGLVEAIDAPFAVNGPPTPAFVMSSAVPGTHADLLPGDLLFVSLVGPSPSGAQDLSVSINITP